MPESNMKILVVDDLAAMRRIIKGLLKELGYDDVEEADDGSSALERLKTEDFDFLITDWNMPNMTGMELLGAVRGEQGLKNLPVLMVTAEAENLTSATEAGVDGCIIKPFSSATLKENIDAILKKINK